MIAVAVLLAFVLAVATAQTNYPMVYQGFYCTTNNRLVTQAGTFATPNACGDRCAAQRFRYASYVPSSRQCLCSNTNEDKVLNPNVNCYALTTPAYTKCWDNAYCGPNGNVYVQAPPVTSLNNRWNSVADCATQCARNADFKFFNYVGSTGQCQCVKPSCGQLIASQGDVSAYAIGSQTCTVASS
jgi:hypothetical protein